MSNIIKKINESEPEDQLELINQVNEHVDKTAADVAEGVEYWFDYQKALRIRLGDWDEDEYEQTYGNIHSVQRMVKENRNKKLQGRTRVTDAWTSVRGRVFLDVVVAYGIGETAYTNLGTIAQRLPVVAAIRALNHIRMERQTLLLQIANAKDKYAKDKKAKLSTDPETVKTATLVGKRSLRVGFPGDIAWLFKETKPEDFDIDRKCPLPTELDLSKLELGSLPCGLFVSLREEQATGLECYADEDEDDCSRFFFIPRIEEEQTLTDQIAKEQAEAGDVAANAGGSTQGNEVATRNETDPALGSQAGTEQPAEGSNVGGNLHSDLSEPAQEGLIPGSDLPKPAQETPNLADNHKGDPAAEGKDNAGGDQQDSGAVAQDTAMLDAPPPHGAGEGLGDFADWFIRDNDPVELAEARAQKKPEKTVEEDEDGQVETPEEDDESGDIPWSHLTEQELQIFMEIKERYRKMVEMKFADWNNKLGQDSKYSDEADGTLTARNAYKLYQETLLERLDALDIIDSDRDGFYNTVTAYPSEISARPPLDGTSCTCQIPEWLKLRIEFNDQGKLRFPENQRVWVIKFMKLAYEMQDEKTVLVAPGMCPFHIRKLASYVNLVVTKKMELPTIQLRLYHLWQNRDKLVAFRINPHFEQWFKRGGQTEIWKKKFSLGASKYRQVDVPKVEDDLNKPGSVSLGLMNKTVERLRLIGASGRSSNFNFQWLWDDMELFSCIASEFRIYAHHNRFPSSKTPGAFVQNMWYSIAQQIVRADHSLWLMHCAARRDGRTEFVAYPDCARYVDDSAYVNFAFVQADLPDGDTKYLDRVNDFVVLGDFGDRQPGHPCLYTLDLGFSHADAVVTSKKQKLKNREWIINDARKKPYQGFEKKLRKICPDWRVLKTNAGSIILAQNGQPICINTNPVAGEFRMVSANYTAFDEENPEKLENGVYWKEVRDAVLSFQPPPTPRWKLPYEVPPTVAPFAAVTSLSGLGPVSDALLGRVPWSNPDVQAEAAYITGLGPEALSEHLDQQQAKVIQEAKKAYKMVFQMERTYGRSSYYHLVWQRKSMIVGHLLTGPAAEPIVDPALLPGWHGPVGGENNSQNAEDDTLAENEENHLEGEDIQGGSQEPSRARLSKVSQGDSRSLGETQPPVVPTDETPARNQDGPIDDDYDFHVNTSGDDMVMLKMTRRSKKKPEVKQTKTSAAEPSRAGRRKLLKHDSGKTDGPVVTDAGEGSSAAVGPLNKGALPIISGKNLPEVDLPKRKSDGKSVPKVAVEGGAPKTLAEKAQTWVIESSDGEAVRPLEKPKKKRARTKSQRDEIIQARDVGLNFLTDMSQFKVHPSIGAVDGDSDENMDLTGLDAMYFEPEDNASNEASKGEDDNQNKVNGDADDEASDSDEDGNEEDESPETKKPGKSSEDAKKTRADNSGNDETEDSDSDPSTTEKEVSDRDTNPKSKGGQSKAELPEPPASSAQEGSHAATTGPGPSKPAVLSSSDHPSPVSSTGQGSIFRKGWKPNPATSKTSSLQAPEAKSSGQPRPEHPTRQLPRRNVRGGARKRGADQNENQRPNKKVKVVKSDEYAVSSSEDGHAEGDQ